MKFPISERFSFSSSFLEEWKNKKPQFGFNGLGEFVFFRTYSRIKENGFNEQWWEVLQRVVEGEFSLQKQHVIDGGLGWDNRKAQISAKETFERMFDFKMIPSGRSLWAMGTPLVMEKGLTSSLFSCAFISTANMKENAGQPFMQVMDLLMTGVGVGGDILGAGLEIKEPNKLKLKYTIPDSREGWVNSVGMAINAFFGGDNYEFDYSEIRPYGSPIKTFGGTASGHEPLKELHEAIVEMFYGKAGGGVTATNIVDIFNLIAKAVVAGNTRRSAEIMIGDKTEEFLNLKNYEVNPHRATFGWASNNTIYAKIGDDYSQVAKRIADNGEPALFWIDNAREYGRMRDGERNNKDTGVMGLNPCGEITLEDGELCNLVEIVLPKQDDLEDFKKTIKYAYLYAKTMTLLGIGWENTNRVLMRNRRIGLSLTGIAQFVAKHGINTLIEWMEEGYKTARYYDDVYSRWLGIRESIKVTTVKPSGTVSLLAGCTAGLHYPESQYYIRRVRVGRGTQFEKILSSAGFHVEPAFGQEESTVVVEFPVFAGENVKTIKDVSMWEQMALASLAQKYWADNSVSVTVTFGEDEVSQIAQALDFFQYGLKAVSLLPRAKDGMYPQMPYEPITEQKYYEMLSKLNDIDYSSLFGSEALVEKFCANDVCEIDFEPSGD